MAYDSNQPADRGNGKMSELAIDRQLGLFDSSVPQQNALVALEVAFEALTELCRRNNYILRSEGQIDWDGTDIKFDADDLVNNIVLEILATEGTINSTFKLRLQGSILANSTSEFLNIPMADGDLLYLELNSALLVDQGASFDLENGVNGGGITSGFRVLRQPMSVAMPKLQIGTSGSGTIFHIPLALRRGSDMFWIPHGIRWPAGTTSVLGAVIVEGPITYPERFVDDQISLLDALGDFLGSGGGTLLIYDGFSIDTPITVPVNVRILGRSIGKNDVTILAGGSLNLQGRCLIDSLKIKTHALFTGNVINLAGGSNRINDCRIDVSPSVDAATVKAVNVASDHNRIKDCLIDGVATSARIGVNYASGIDNADIDCVYT